MVEREPSKLGVAGSSPVSRSKSGWAYRAHSAHVAQSVEHFLGKEEVTGSIPVVGFGNWIGMRPNKARKHGILI